MKIYITKLIPAKELPTSIYEGQWYRDGYGNTYKRNGLIGDECRRMEMWLHFEGLPLAEVSCNADWVTEGMLFTPDQVHMELTNNDRRSKHIVVGDPVMTEGDGGTITGILKEIKAVNPNSYAWADIFVITDAKRSTFENGEIVKVPIPDLELARSAVKFHPTSFWLAEVQCSQCNHFH